MSARGADEVAELFRVMAQLRAPTGCPWDRQQTHRSLLPYLLEETYELIEAVECGEDAEIAEELGDLMVEVAMHTAIAEDRGAFGIEDVAVGATTKMVARHPHVFGDAKADSHEQLLANWDSAKRSEKPERMSALDGIPKALPALALAASVQRRAARGRVPRGQDVDLLDQAAKLLRELDAADAQGAERLVGQLLFLVVELASARGVDSEGALRRATRKWSSEYRSRERLEPGGAR